ncbi:hypothetical protein Bca4012_085010 [Brassica carinata]
MKGQSNNACFPPPCGILFGASKCLFQEPTRPGRSLYMVPTSLSPIRLDPFYIFTTMLKHKTSQELTGDSSSDGKGLTAVSTATWVRIPATGELTFRHRQGQRTDTWQHVTSVDHFCRTRIPLYNSKKKKKTKRHKS